MPAPSRSAINRKRWEERLTDPEFIEFLNKNNYSQEYSSLTYNSIVLEFRNSKEWSEKIASDPTFVSFLEANQIPLEINKSSDVQGIMDLYESYKRWNEKVSTNQEFAGFLNEFHYPRQFNKDTHIMILSQYKDYLMWKKFKGENPEYIKEALEGKLDFEEYTKSPEKFKKSLEGWQWLKSFYPSYIEFAKQNNIPYPKDTTLYENRAIKSSVIAFISSMQLAKKSENPSEAFAHYREEYDEFAIAQKMGADITFLKYCTLKDMNEYLHLYDIIGSAYYTYSAQADLDDTFASVKKVQSSIAHDTPKEEKKSLLKRFFGKEKGKNAALKYAIDRHKTGSSLEELLSTEDLSFASEHRAREAENIIGCYNATEKVLKDPELQRKCGISLKPSEVSFDSIFDYFWKEASWYPGKVYDTESYLLLPVTIRQGIMNGISKKNQASIINSSLDAMKYLDEDFGSGKRSL